MNILNKMDLIFLLIPLLLISIVKSLILAHNSISNCFAFFNLFLSQLWFHTAQIKMDLKKIIPFYLSKNHELNSKCGKYNYI